jgi:glutamate racemase
MKKAIGIFDSGLGGLEILREIIDFLPEYDYLYLGDSARAPYGNRSYEEIHKFTSQAVDFLFDENCPLVILACNTASSKALRRIQGEYSEKVLGVLIPAAEKAVEMTKNNKIGVIATKGTVFSKAFMREIKKLKPETEVFQEACPLLVPLIESGEKNVKPVLEKCLKPLVKRGIDVLILGCTHYGLIKQDIEKITPKEIKILAEGKIVAQKLKDYLQRHKEIEEQLTKNSSIEILTTGLSSNFEKIGKKFFQKEFKAKKVKL